VTDPLAALKVWAIEVDLGGKTYRIEPTPAAGWFVAILREDALPIVPGMMSVDDQVEIIDRLAFGEFGIEELTTAARDALETASGWRWWMADRMIRSAGQDWKVVSGQLIKRGIDLSTLPLGAVLNALYAMAVETLDTSKRSQFDFDLGRPPAGALSEEEREEEAAAMMMAAMQQAQTGSSS
jgi:hypothetical protein